MYSQEKNFAASFLISTFMCLWEIDKFPRSFHIHLFSCSWIGRPIVRILYINRSQTQECGNWDRGRPRNSFAGNICFEFSVLCLCCVQSISASIHKWAIPLDRKYKGDLSYTLFHTLCMSVSNDSWILESQKENGPLLVSFELQRCCTVHTALQFECLSAESYSSWKCKMTSRMNC